MLDILFPAGRMIGGSLDKLNPRTDNNGQPKLGKDGKPEMQCNIGVAIPKGAEKHWSETAWGAEILKIGAEAHPKVYQSPSFSWKITDGDSTIQNKNGKRPCDQAGYPGNWVLWFSQGWLPKRCNADGSIELPEGSIVPGFYVQVFGGVAGNKPVPNGTPGVYLNPIAVALVGEGDRIATDVDTKAIGFGAVALPSGARPVQPAVPGFAQAAAPAPAPAPAAPVAVAPAPAFLQPAPSAPVAPPPAAPAGPRMTAKAGQFTYEQMIAAGWTDDTLRANGYME